MKFDTTAMSWVDNHKILVSSFAPLPIALISTVGPDGTPNAAPFSFTCPITSKPPVVCFSSGFRRDRKKDTVRNIEYSQDFVINVVDEKILNQAIQTSVGYPYGVDEIKTVGLTAIQSDKVKSPRISEAMVNLECRLVQKIEFIEEAQVGRGLRSVIFGEVVVAHIKDEVWSNGEIDVSRLKPIGLVGENLYCRLAEIFELKPLRPM